MDHFLEEKIARACLFFLRIMKYFNTSCKISGLEFVSTLLPSVMIFNVLAILQPLWQSNLGVFFSDF